MSPAGHSEWLELMNTPGESAGNGERRRSHRVPLHWTLYLASHEGTHPRRTETQNLSKDGFYFLLDEPLMAGEHVDCDIIVPTHKRNCDDVMSLRCRAQVIRVEKVDCSQQYGLACRIEDYRVIHIQESEKH